jgi:hypothetical protein
MKLKGFASCLLTMEKLNFNLSFEQKNMSNLWQRQNSLKTSKI